MYVAYRADKAGIELRQLRESLSLTVREVETLSQPLTADNQNHYFSFRGLLNNVENDSCRPSLFKMYSLDATYRTRCSNRFALFGLHLCDLGRDRVMLALPKMQLAADSPGSG